MRQRQEGFALLEIVVALGIAGAAMAAIVMIITTLLINSGQPSIKETLLQQVQNAGFQMPRDIQMANNVTLGSPNGFPLTINIPVDQDANHDYSVEYLFDSDRLKRQEYDSSDNPTAATLIAQYVDVDNTTLESITEGSYKLTIRVSTDEEELTASYEARQRLTLTLP